MSVACNEFVGGRGHGLLPLATLEWLAGIVFRWPHAPALVVSGSGEKVLFDAHSFVVLVA